LDQKDEYVGIYESTGHLPIRGSTPDFSNNFKRCAIIFKNLLPKILDQKDEFGDIYESTGHLPIRGSTPDFSNNFKRCAIIFNNLLQKFWIKKTKLVTTPKVQVICGSVDPPLIFLIILKDAQ
jgi:hypothetical protein